MALYKRSNSLYNSLFTTFHKVQHCTGYPLIQVEIASYMKKSLYALAGFPKFFLVDFLVPGVCGHSLTVSSVGAGAGSSAGASSAISSFLSENTESDTEAVLNFVWVTRLLGILLTELCRTRFLSSLEMYGK